MVEKELSENCSRKKTRQPVSVPFLWEEKPGTPKKDWKPSTLPVNPVAPPPIKLVVSVPFKWEEKPGKPLACFLEPLPESALQLTTAEAICLSWPPAYSQGNGNGNDGDNNSGNIDGNDNDDDDNDDKQFQMFESDLEACGFETDESFCSVPSLLANRLVSTVVISSAVPAQQTFLVEDCSGQLQTPSSPASETDSSTSSYATGTTSLVGVSFLERLFPLLSPDSSFLYKVGCSEKISSQIPLKLQSKDFDRESNCSVVIRKPVTLGELIMMSRRRSYIRKAVQMRRQNLSMEFMKKSAFGCCIFGTSNRLAGLRGKWKRQLRLKLV